MGWAAGKLFGYLSFRLRGLGLAKSKDGIVAIGMAFATYGMTELIHGYGFVAVFLAAVAFRHSEREHEFHEELHDFAEQIERLLMMVLLVCLGAISVSARLFANIDWRIIVVAVLTLALIRPLLGWLSLIGSPRSTSENLVIAIFGIRGLGSIYYLAYASGHASFDKIEVIWATVLLIILASIFVHGIAVTPTMRWIDGTRRMKVSTGKADQDCDS